VVHGLNFTQLLLQNTYSRAYYGSYDSLITLLKSKQLEVVIGALKVLVVISKDHFMVKNVSTHTLNKIGIILCTCVQVIITIGL